MLKKITFSIIAVLLAASLTFAGEYDNKTAKKVTPDTEVASGLNKLPAKNMSKVSADQLGFTDYDYAGNSTVNEQLWPYDIDGDGVLDPIAVWMQRFNTSEDGTRRVMMSVGLAGEFASFDASDRTLYTGWGVVQSIDAGPWAGHAAVMMHEGGAHKLSLFDLATFAPVQFHADMNVAQNFPSFAYLDDGTIVHCATDGVVRKGSTDDITAWTEVGLTVPTAASENPVRKSPNGDYLAIVADNGTDSLFLYVSEDQGTTWSTELIGQQNITPIDNRPGLEPLFVNFGQRSYAVSNDGVVHIGWNGYSIDTSTPDTSAAFPALYWNSNHKTWLAISDEAEEDGELLDYYPGNGIGNAYPTPVVSEDGSVVAVMYQAPEYDGGLNLYEGTVSIYYTDIKYAVSEDGGASFDAPVHAAGNPSESDVFPAAYDWLVQEGNEYTIHFMYMTDAIPGVSLFADNNEESEDSYWNYESVTFTAEPSSVEDGEVPVTFALDQNYPNPFNPSTTIKYSVPELTDVTLKVYDVLGKEVATLVDAAQVGSYTVEFDASNLASGLYIYTLKAGSFTSSKKMMLMK